MSQSLIFKSGIDDSAFARGLRGMEKDAARTTANIGNSFRSAGSAISGALAGAGLGAFIKSVVDFGGALTDQAEAIGFNIETMQGFQGAMEQAGVSEEKFTRGMVNLNQSIQDAKDNVGIARESFDKLGIQWEDIANDSPEEILLKISEALKTATNPGEAFSAALDIIGKKQYAVVAALKQGREAFLEQANAIDKMSAETASQLDAAGDALTRFGTKMKVIGAQAIIGWAAIFGQDKKVDTSKVDAVTKDLEAKIAAKEKAAMMRREAQKTFGFVPAETEDFIRDNIDIKSEPKAATPEDPRIAKARAEAKADADKAGASIEGQMGGEAKKFFADQEKRKAATAELNKLRKEMYLDSLTGEQRLQVLAQDRQKLEKEFGGAGADRKLEIAKQVLEIRKDEIRETEKLKDMEARAAQDKQKAAEEEQNMIHKTKEDALGTAQAQTSQAASNLRAVLDGKGPKKKSSKEKRLDRMVNAVMSGRQVSFTKRGSAQAVKDLQAAQANEKNARASLEQTNTILEQIKKGIVG